MPALVFDYTFAYRRATAGRLFCTAEKQLADGAKGGRHKRKREAARRRKIKTFAATRGTEITNET